MFLKEIFLLVCIGVSGTLSQSEQERIEKLMAQFISYGDPDNLIPTEQKEGKESCNRFSNSVIKTGVEFANKVWKTGITKGVIKKSVWAVIKQRDECEKLTSDDNIEKYSEQSQQINTNVEAAKLPRIQFTVALMDALKPNTATTLPLLICQLKQYITLTINAYPEDMGTRERVRTRLNTVFGTSIEYIQGIAGKPLENCSLPNAPTSLPNKTLPSIHGLLFSAISSITKNIDQSRIL